MDNRIALLDAYMPFSGIYEATEYPVKDAPKVKGFFGFIGLKYMKRVKNIKKLCVEYINTYVEGSMNVANNMDSVKLTGALENLATEVGFKSSGFNTYGKEKGASTKEGVAFLTGDRAIMDKLTSIKNQIGIYASKSASLKAWAGLMLEKSREIACDIVFNKTKEMIKDEDKVKELEAEFEKYKAEKEEEIEEMRKTTEKLSKEMEKSGDFSSMNHDMYDLKAIREIAKTDYTKDFAMAWDDKDSGIFKLRSEFYLDNKSNWGMDNFDGVAEAIGKAMAGNDVQSELSKIDGDDKKAEAGNEIGNYLFASYMARVSEIKKGQYVSPVDLKILRGNMRTFKAQITGSSKAREDMEYSDKPVFMQGISSDALDKAEETSVDRNKLVNIAREWSYTFGEECLYPEKVEKANESFSKPDTYVRPRIMSFDEFVNESKGE